jgi:hypothetical protein
MMERGTIHFNRQVIRLCKGIIKAWEQWMDEVEYGELDQTHHHKSQSLRKEKDNENEKENDKKKESLFNIINS